MRWPLDAAAARLTRLRRPVGVHREGLWGEMKPRGDFPPGGCALRPGRLPRPPCEESRRRACTGGICDARDATGILKPDGSRADGASSASSATSAHGQLIHTLSSPPGHAAPWSPRVPDAPRTRPCTCAPLCALACLPRTIPASWAAGPPCSPGAGSREQPAHSLRSASQPEQGLCRVAPPRCPIARIRFSRRPRRPPCISPRRRVHQPALRHRPRDPTDGARAFRAALQPE